MPGEVTFYTGTHRPHWLGLWRVPLFVSRRRLAAYVTLPRARAPWALDSGGFTEIGDHGRWTVSASDYAIEVRRFMHGVGNMQWAAPQDWMCEPKMLEKTGLTVEEHQRRSVQSYLDLTRIAPDIPWIPVLQGWEPADYHRCVEMFYAAGVQLHTRPTVGVGTVCRRQHSQEIADILGSLAARGLRLHGFGVKMKGLEKAAQHLVSADSMAWSYSGVKNPPLPGCTHKNCANCLTYAKLWRNRVVNIHGIRKVLRTDHMRPDTYREWMGIPCP